MIILNSELANVIQIKICSCELFIDEMIYLILTAEKTERDNTNYLALDLNKMRFVDKR